MQRHCCNSGICCNFWHLAPLRPGKECSQSMISVRDIVLSACPGNYGVFREVAVLHHKQQQTPKARLPFVAHKS